MKILANENGKTARVVKSMGGWDFLEFVGFGTANGNLRKQRKQMKRFAAKHNINITGYPHNNIPSAMK